MHKKLDTSFFNRPALSVARELLGKFLVRRLDTSRRASLSKIGRGELAFMITEVEAYDGIADKGSHASRGMTARNAPMFGPPGHWYVYFTYGMHWMLNVVTRKEGYPAAVLIRGIGNIRGPGRVTKLLNITGAMNGKPAASKTGLWIEDRGYRQRNGWIYPPSHKASEDDFQHTLKIKRGPRVGIAYAGRIWARKPWRFWIKPEKVR